MDPNLLAEIKEIAETFLWGHPEFRFARATEKQRTFAAVLTLQGIIDNGGLEYLFEQPLEGDPTYAKSIEAFGVIGAGDSQEALRSAIALFPNGVPSNDRERKKQWESIVARNMPRLKDLNKQLWRESDRNHTLLVEYARNAGLTD